MVSLVIYTPESTKVVQGPQPSEMPTSISVSQRSISGAAEFLDTNNILDIATAVRYISSYNNGTVPDVSVSGAARPLVLSSSVAALTFNPTTGAGTVSLPVAAEGQPVAANITLVDRGQTYKPLGVVKRGGNTYIRPVTTTVGSLAEHINNQVASRIYGQAYTDGNRLLFSSCNYSTSALVAVRNPNNPIADIDISWMSVSQVRSGKTDGPYSPTALISPRHVLQCDHYPPVPSRIAFLGRDGNSYYANVVSSISLTDTIDDLRLCYLDAPVSEQVTRIAILPADYKSYIPFIYNTEFKRVGALSVHPVRVFCRLLQNSGVNYEAPLVDTRHRIGWTSLLPTNNAETGRTYFGDIVYLNSTNYNIDSGRNAGDGTGFQETQAINWCDWAFPGDSGGHIFTVINGVTVMLSHYWTVSWGSNPSGKATYLNTKMREMAVAQGDSFQYTMNEVDLSSFPTF